MDATTQSAGKYKLKRSLAKSLGKVRLSKRGKLTANDKSKLKRATVSAVQKFLKAELKKTNVKTYDWYFFKEFDKVYHIEAMRNELMHNRYFIIDNEGKQTLMGTENSFVSTVGKQRIRQFDISSKEIGDIISSSAQLFADMMKITVSEKEDAKIWKAYDTVDEKTIITVTIGLPAAIITSGEAIPLMIMASKSSAFSAMTSSLGKAFTLNSGRQMGVNAGLEFGSQYFSNGIANNDWGLSNIDMADVAASSIFGKGADVLLGSSLDFTYDKGLKFNSAKVFSQNMLVGGLKFKGSKTFGSSAGTPLGNLSKNIGGIYDFGGKLTIQTVIESFRKETGNKL